jgi:antitoxin YobK
MATIEDVERFIEVNREYCDSGNPASAELIDKAEQFLSVQFPEDYRKFLARWGTLDIGPIEFYGICGDDFVNSTVPDAIWYTQRKRLQVNLPDELIVLCDDDGDVYFCLDTSDQVGSRVVVWDAIHRELRGVRAGSIFEFIIEQSRDTF